MPLVRDLWAVRAEIDFAGEEEYANSDNQDYDWCPPHAQNLSLIAHEAAAETNSDTVVMRMILILFLSPETVQ